LSNCARSDALAKTALNAVTEVFVDICKKSGSSIGTNWRQDYSARKFAGIIIFKEKFTFDAKEK